MMLQYYIIILFDNNLVYKLNNRSIYSNINIDEVVIQMLYLNLVYYQLVRQRQQILVSHFLKINLSG